MVDMIDGIFFRSGYRLVDEGNLVIKHADQSDEGSYTCQAENSVGVRLSPPALLSVHGK